MGENSPTPSSSSSPNKLNLFWDSFLNAESKSYVRGVWLDGFLAEYLVLLKEGQNVNEILPSSCNVAALVACELLSDVHETCSQLGNEDYLSALKKYLLSGRGWRFLAVLRSLKLQDVSCSKELATLLISLFSVNVEESRVENRARNPYVQDLALSDLSDYVDRLKLPSKRKHMIPNVGATENTVLSPKNRKISNASRRQGKSSPAENQEKRDEQEILSTESEALSASLATTKSSNIRMRIDPMDFEYFQSYVRSEDDVRKDSASYCPSEPPPRRTRKLTPEALFDDRINDVFKQKVNFSEFKIVVVDLLKKLAMSESLNTNECSDVNQSIACRTLMFALEKLCNLQFSSSAGEVQKPGHCVTLKSALVRLLLTSLSRFLTISDITPAVMQNGIVPMMKKLLEDAMSKCESSENSGEVSSNSRAINEDIDIIFSVLYGLIILFHRLLLQSNNSLEKLGQFLSLLGRFSDSRSGKLVDRAIDIILGPEPCNNETNVERVKQILISVSRLVTALKRTRSKIVHSRLCKRNRHKHCSLWSISYHHDLVFGEVYSQSLISPNFSYNCCVSSLFMSLSKCLNFDNLVVYTLQAMMSCGGCCCFPSSMIVTKLLDLIRKNDAKIRCVAFMFLEKTLYRQMGALRPVEQFLSREGADLSSKCCQVCPEKAISLVDSHEAAADSISGKKSCLDTFCDLLLSTDSDLSHGVSSHLLRVVPRCRPEIQKEMLFDIFYPVFLSAKTTYTTERSESSKFLLLTCLSAFTNLLVTVKFMEQFHSMSGLNHIEDLLYEPDFIKPCCSVIEIAILVQVVSWDVSGLESEVLRDNEISMSNLDILLKYVNNSTEHLLQYALKLECESSDKESSSESGASHAIRRFLDKFFPNSCTSPANSFSMINHTLEATTTDDWGRFRCLLEQCMVLWRTCTNICIYSPQMRKYFSRHPISQQSFDLLCMTLDQIGLHTNVGGTKCSEISEKLFSANQDTIKLFESLLILNIIAPTLDANSGTLMTIECVMSALKEKLLTALNNGNVSARHLCDVLLRASTLLPSEKIVIPQHKMPKLGDGMTLSDGVNSEPTSNFVLTDFDEVMSSPNSTPELSADEGYEADVDVPETGIVEDVDAINGHSSSTGSGRKLSVVDTRRDLIITYPGLCNVVIQMLAHYLNGSPDEETREPGLFSAKLSDSVYCIQRLGSLCQDSDENCLTLSRQNFIAQLMKLFQRFITSADPQYLGIQQAVLAVISHIAQRNIEATELSQLLQLFTADKPSMDPLLVCLNRIVSNVRSQPQSFVNFPTNCKEEEMIPSSALDPAEKMAMSLRTSHTTSGIESSWSKSSAILPLNQELGWSMWASGLSLSLWFCINKPFNSLSHQRSSVVVFEADVYSDNQSVGASNHKRASRSNSALLTAGLLHLASIGYETLTLEFWIHPHSDILIVRLNRLDVNMQEILVEKKIDLHLTSGVWQHLAINVKDNFQKRKVNLQVTLIFNGCHEVPVELSFVGLLIRKSRCTCLLVGHNNSSSSSSSSKSSNSNSTAHGGWQLGNLLMFRSPVFSKEKATCLMAYGPDHCYLIETEVGNTRPSMASVFSKGPLSANIDWDAILNNQADMMKELQESLLLVYTARSPQSVCVYPQVVPNNTGVVGSLLASQVGFRVVAVDGRASQQLPMCLSPALVAPTLRPTLLHSFHLASNSIGGVSLFLFLFARVVELEASEETQAKALLLLLRVVNSNAEFYSQFFSQEQDHLLTLVLTSSRCKLGLHILKAILDVCCDRPGLLVHQQLSSCQQLAVVGQSRALLVDGALLACSLLACWRGWLRSGCLATVLQLLLVLLRDDHPRREFNLAQLNRIDALQSLLTFCKESFEDSFGLQDREVCVHIVELVQSLMSAPPRHDQIEAVMKFLVLAHPADLTYITHLWSSFYFVLAAKRPHILQRPNFITSARLNILAQSSSDKAEKMKKNRSFLAGNYSTASENDKKSANLAVDPQKLNKALANLQIKEETSNREEEVWVQEANNYCDSGIAGSFRDYSDLETPLSQPDKARTASKENRAIIAKSVENDGSCSPASEIVEAENQNQKLPKIDENSLSDQTERVKIFKISDTPETPGTPDNKDESRLVCESERASDLVTEGLLQRLHDIILVLPDSNAQIVLERIVKIEALLVMANHPSSRIRVAVIKIVTAYLQRATDEELNRFLRLKGFQLLANQVFAHEVSGEVATAVVTLLTGRHWLPLEEQLLADSEPVLVSPLQMAALPALLALLPKAALTDLALTAHLVAFVERFFNKVPQAFRALTEAGILEVLLKTLLAVAHSSSNEVTTDPNQGKVLNAIHSFLIAIVSQTVQGVGNYYIQVMNDLIALFNCLEKQERHDCDDKSRCVYVLRAAHCTLLETALAVIQNKISFQQPLVARIRSSATAFFNNVFQANFEDYLVDSDRYRRGSSSSLSSSPGGAGLNSLMVPLASGVPDKTRLTHNDLVDRFRTIITKSVEFITNNIPIDGKYCNLSTLELHFIRRLLSCFMGYIVPIVDRKSVPKTSWNNTMWTARDTIRNQTAKLLIWMLAPAHHNKVRLSVVNAIRNEPKAQDIVLFVLDSNQAEENMMLFMWDLVNGQGADSLSEEQRTDCVDLCDRLQAWGVRSEMCVTGRCEEDVSLAWERDMLEQKIWWKTQEANAYRCLLKMEGIVKSVSECALSVMKTVTDDQNCERKQLMDRIRTELSERVHTQILWKTVVRQLCHERAVWYFPKSYPRSWQLDPTEGPARIRIRLQRCHLSIKKKFMKPEFVYKTESLEVPQPLSYLFDSEGRTISSMSAFLIEKLHTDQKIRHMATARVITPALEVPGELLIGETCVYFIPSSNEHEELAEATNEEAPNEEGEENRTPSNELNAGALDMSAQAWQFEEIKEIHTRRFQLKEQALEIFLLNGKTFLLAFQSPTERDEFKRQLLQCELPNRVPSDNLLDAVQLWREGQLTNWEYLMTLNKMAGRTYNDLMQYPILPFVLAAYHRDIIDLADPANYRNLQKPMAVQNKANEHHYIKHYNYFKQEMPVGSGSTFSGPYHYGSHYSNSGSVLHFLVRLPPFTSMFLQYQDKNFDLPDRTFHCLETTWRLSSRESTTDVKELLPEFFFLPEFLTNIEGFDFGVRQNGERVDNVTLPKWAFADPRRFILIHRQALESDYVRENLPHWIDLVFGYKQTGKAAVDAVNVFHPATYYGFDVETIEDPLVRTAWETMVRTYGQTPRQLFKIAHPMVVQSLAPKHDSPSIQGVKGLQWGSYVGSPTEAAPTAVLHQHHRTPVAHLVPLLTNDVFGLAPQTTLLLAYSKEKTLSLVSSGGMCIHGAALISWGHPEGVLRLKGKKEQPPYPVIRPPATNWDIITHCTSVPDSAQLWIGYSSGRILVYRYRFIVGKNTVEFAQQPEVLVGHSQAILSLALSHEFSVAVSGSHDGSCIIWDMNRISYVQSLPDISMPVALACVSSTLGDIVTVGQEPQSNVSTLRLHSINAAFLGSITTQTQITAVCFSNAHEGVSINVIATGMHDGSVKLWSTWDLSPVCDVTSPNLTQPIVSLTYSHDSQHLYASAGGVSGYVVVWQNGSSKTLGSKLPKYLNLTNLI